jgi:hypothetical protein
MYSKGISWIDDCRIPFEDTQNPATNPKYRLQGDYKMPEKGQISDGSITQFRSSLNEIDVRGRFPANLLVSDDMLNDGIIYSSGSGDGKMEMININDAHHFNFIEKNRKVVKMKGVQYNDKGTNSRYYDIDKWFDNLIDV